MKKLIILLFFLIAYSCKKEYHTSSSGFSYRGPTGNVLIYTSNSLHKKWMFRFGSFGERKLVPYFKDSPVCDSSSSEKIPAGITNIVTIDCYINSDWISNYPLYISVDSNQCKLIDIE